MTPQSKNIFRIHLGLFLAELICIPAFIIEMNRALDGNALSWAYVFEWPALGGYAIYMWRKMILDERGQVKPKRAKGPDTVDPRLEEWNAYLASVHQQDQPLTPESRDD
ncbi:MAG TPA: hypothetical protein VG246_04090 [Acidimicrobiales bacterium]|jgi:hypothetical protein|nr:hypothetical protein [Acidimicrobiales bacterium]